MLFGLLSAGVEAVAVEFFAHGEAGDAEPAGGLSLVALGAFDGGGEQLPFEGFDEEGVGAVDFAVGGAAEGFGDEFAEGAVAV